jgi:hypothetical protein
MRALLITSADGYNVQMMSLTNNQLVEEYLLPMQVAPSALAVNETQRSVYVLNSGSNTITTADEPKAFEPTFRFNLRQLSEYRAAMINAYIDLLGGFLQYLKDCLCQHLLVECPECTGEEKLYLACVSIRNGQVERVCNFSKRKYVKSFPTVDYWLSLVPIMPMLGQWVEKFCCMLLPDLFGKFTVKPTDDQYSASYKARVSSSTVFDGVAALRGLDLLPQITRFFERGRTASNLAVERLGVSATQPINTATRQPAIVNQATNVVSSKLSEQGVPVRTLPYTPGQVTNLTHLFRDPGPDDEVVLYEQDGLVRYYQVQPRRIETSEALRTHLQSLSDALQSRDSEVQTLRSRVEELTQRQQRSQVQAPNVEIAALRAEVEELRAFRAEVTAFMQQPKPPTPKSSGGKTPKATK